MSSPHRRSPLPLQQNQSFSRGPGESETNPIPPNRSTSSHVDLDAPSDNDNDDDDDDFHTEGVTPHPISTSVSRRHAALTLEEIERHFHLPLHEACVQLHVDETHLKSQCRRLGIARWPYRKRLTPYTSTEKFPSERHSVSATGSMFMSFQIGGRHAMERGNIQQCSTNRAISDMQSALNLSRDTASGTTETEEGHSQDEMPDVEYDMPNAQEAKLFVSSNMLQVSNPPPLQVHAVPQHQESLRHHPQRKQQQPYRHPHHQQEDITQPFHFPQTTSSSQYGISSTSPPPLHTSVIHDRSIKFLSAAPRRFHPETPFQSPSHLLPSMDLYQYHNEQSMYAQCRRHSMPSFPLQESHQPSQPLFSGNVSLPSIDVFLRYTAANRDIDYDDPSTHGARLPSSPPPMSKRPEVAEFHGRHEEPLPKRRRSMSPMGVQELQILHPPRPRPRPPRPPRPPFFTSTDQQETPPSRVTEGYPRWSNTTTPIRSLPSFNAPRHSPPPSSSRASSPPSPP